MAKEVFTPGCRIVEEESDERRTTYSCTPTYEGEGTVFHSEHPAKIVLEQGQGIIREEGDNPEFILEKLLRHFERHKIRR